MGRGSMIVAKIRDLALSDRERLYSSRKILDLG
jgi:hypothetical protein